MMQFQSLNMFFNPRKEGRYFHVDFRVLPECTVFRICVCSHSFKFRVTNKRTARITLKKQMKDVKWNLPLCEISDGIKLLLIIKSNVAVPDRMPFSHPRRYRSFSQSWNTLATIFCIQRWTAVWGWLPAEHLILFLQVLSCPSQQWSIPHGQEYSYCS